MLNCKEMNINFEKTDRLISLIEDSIDAVKPRHFMGAHFIKDSMPAFYDELVEITANDDTDDVKDELRIQAFTKAYKYNVADYGNEFLKNEFLMCTFDENKILSCLTKAYWQIQTRRKVTENTSFVLYEPYDNIAAEVVKEQEPTVKDIEKEFWLNCPDIDKIDELCNIYRERWSDHFYKIDLDFYSMRNLHTGKNELGEYLKELRMCGILRNDCLPEMLLCGIAQEINSLCDSIIKLLQMMRRSAEPTTKIEQGTLSTNNATPPFRLDKEKESEVFRNFEFWESREQDNKSFGYVNIFNGYTRKQFLEMIDNTDFSELYNKSSIKQRVGYNVGLLSKIINNDEWTCGVERNLNTTIRRLMKNANFPEHKLLKDEFQSYFKRNISIAVKLP